MAPSYLIAPLLLTLSFAIPAYGQATTINPAGVNGQMATCDAIVKFCPGGFPKSPGLLTPSNAPET